MENIYIKLSGAFSEVWDEHPEDSVPVSGILQLMRPWLEMLFKFFPAERIMFGSDWPVCNVRGPGHRAWATWRAVVAQSLDENQLCDDDKAWIWWKTAKNAYRLE